MKKKKEKTHQESFQLEIRVRCRERKEEKEVGNKSQESGRVASQERKGRGESRTCKYYISREEDGSTKRMRKKNGGTSVRENETLQILIKIKPPGGSFRKSAQLFKAAHSDQPQC